MDIEPKKKMIKKWHSKNMKVQDNRARSVRELRPYIKRDRRSLRNCTGENVVQNRS
jgi:hypothetical protein